MKLKLRAYIISVCALLFFQSSFCQVKLPRLVRDSMVLQRDAKVKIWGWASPKEKIKISFQNKNYNKLSIVKLSTVEFR